MTTGISPGAFDGSMMKMIGYDMALAGAQQVYEAAGIGPEDIDVVEMHDCFTANELISYESLGFARHRLERLNALSGTATTWCGKVVINPSGGLLSKGHPLGATGLAQCAELVWQLRGQVDKKVLNVTPFETKSG